VWLFRNDPLEKNHRPVCCVECLGLLCLTAHLALWGMNYAQDFAGCSANSDLPLPSLRRVRARITLARFSVPGRACCSPGLLASWLVVLSVGSGGRHSGGRRMTPEHVGLTTTGTGTAGTMAGTIIDLTHGSHSPGRQRLSPGRSSMHRPAWLGC
jgi:hypothetical protein